MRPTVLYLFFIAFPATSSFAQDRSYLSTPVIKEIMARDAALKKGFFQLVNQDKQLPDTNEVTYHFITSYMTTVKEDKVLSKEDFETGNFLYKISLASASNNADNFLTEAFYTTSSNDTAFLVYNSANGILIGPRKRRKKRRASFSVAKVNQDTKQQNQRLVDFLSFCRKNNVKAVLYSSPSGVGVLLSHAFCISDTTVYVIKNKNIADPLTVHEFVKEPKLYFQQGF